MTLKCVLGPVLAHDRVHVLLHLTVIRTSNPQGNILKFPR